MLYTITFLFLLFRAPQMSIPVDTQIPQSETQEIENGQTYWEDTEPRPWPKYPTS